MMRFSHSADIVGFQLKKFVGSEPKEDISKYKNVQESLFKLFST